MNITKLIMDLTESKKFTSCLETLLVVWPSFFIVLITVNLVQTAPDKSNLKKVFIVELFVIVVPIILMITILVPFVPIFNLLVLTLSAFVIITKKRTEEHYDVEYQSMGDIEITKKPFITNARSTINIITAVAILAVDFAVFPKRFRKTFRYGFSLMDLGVGMFIFANGIVAPETRGCKNSLWKTFLNVVPILVIGIGRFIVTHLIHYSVDVSEYGLHWNFFITLAVTKLISAIVMSLFANNFWTSGIQGLSLIALHQTILNKGLEKYVFSNVKRTDFFAANREGIVSSIGYIGLYFLSVSFGFLVTGKNKIKLCCHLLTSISITGLLTTILYSKFNISRCVANSTYCFWVLFLGILMTSLFYAAELFMKRSYKKYSTVCCVPFIYEAINYNALFFFLVANVLTGLVNIMFVARKLSAVVSIIILFIYMLVTCSIVCLLYVKKIRLTLKVLLVKLKV